MPIESWDPNFVHAPAHSARIGGTINPSRDRPAHDGHAARDDARDRLLVDDDASHSERRT